MRQKELHLPLVGELAARLVDNRNYIDILPPVHLLHIHLTLLSNISSKDPDGRSGGCKVELNAFPVTSSYFDRCLRLPKQALTRSA